MEPTVLLMGNEVERLQQMEMIVGQLGCETQLLLLTEDSARSPITRPELVTVDLTSGLSPQVANRAIRNQIGEGAVATLAAMSLDQLLDFEPRLGFDDFVVWPCAAVEFQARVRRALTTGDSVDPAHLVRVGDLMIDKASFRAYLGTQPLALTYKEYELLLFLATNRDRVLTREAILNRVWGYDYYGGARTVDVHIRRLRTKIEDRGHSFIETVRNVGYRFHTE